MRLPQNRPTNLYIFEKRRSRSAHSAIQIQNSFTLVDTGVANVQRSVSIYRAEHCQLGLSQETRPTGRSLASKPEFMVVQSRDRRVQLTGSTSLGPHGRATSEPGPGGRSAGKQMSGPAAVLPRSGAEMLRAASTAHLGIGP